MQKNTLTLKGMRTPRPIIFVHGFLNGRFQTAAVDQESRLLNSAYVNGKRYLFSELCKKRVIRLETELSAVCTEADALILELRDLPTLPRCEDDGVQEGVVEKPPKTIAEAQSERLAARSAAQAAEAAAQAKAKRDQLIERRAEIIRRLVEIRDKIAVRERICCEELAATADALRERFAVYGHGVLLKPVCDRYIPAVEYAGALEGYQADHEALKCRIANVLNKEESDNV